MGFGTYLSNFIVENLWNFVQLWQLFPYVQVIILKGKTKNHSQYFFTAGIYIVTMLKR